MNQTTRRRYDPILRRGRRGRHEDAANLTRTHSVGQIPSLHSGLDSHRTARSAICASLPRQRAPQQLVRPPNSRFDPPLNKQPLAVTVTVTYRKA